MAPAHPQLPLTDYRVILRDSESDREDHIVISAESPEQASQRAKLDHAGWTPEYARTVPLAELPPEERPTALAVVAAETTLEQAMADVELAKQALDAAEAAVLVAETAVAEVKETHVVAVAAAEAQVEEVKRLETEAQERKDEGLPPAPLPVVVPPVEEPPVPEPPIVSEGVVVEPLAVEPASVLEPPVEESVVSEPPQ